MNVRLSLAELDPDNDCEVLPVCVVGATVFFFLDSCGVVLTF